MASLVILALVIVWLVAVIFFRYSRIWMLYYIVGSVGLALLLIFVSRFVLPIEFRMESYTALGTHYSARLFGVLTRLFEAVPGSILVLIVAQEKGWTVVEITIECSSILEGSVMIGLLVFYPGWPVWKKTYLGLIGLAATFASNIIRMTLIVTTVSKLGKDSLFMAHTILGRLVFFIATVLTYWFVLTRPTLKDVHRKLREELMR